MNKYIQVNDQGINDQPIIHQILKQINLFKDKEINGIFQWSGKEQLTKYDMIVAMSRVLSLSHDHITPDPNPAPGAPRPYDARMDSSRLEALGISHHTAFDVGIKECLNPWLVQGNGQRKGRQGWVWGVKHCCYCCSQGYFIVKICKER